MLDQIDLIPGGTAEDPHSGVVRIAVEIRDRSDDRYWGVAGSQVGWYGAPLAGPVPTFDAQLQPAGGGNLLSWEAILWDPQTAMVAGGSGEYKIRVFAYDAQDNGFVTPYVNFSVDNAALP